MKYSKNFQRDFNWYLKVRNKFNFSGRDDWSLVKYDKQGVDGKKAFFLYDSQGKLVATKHPSLFHSLLKTKGSVNLHIKMYSEDRARGVLCGLDFNTLCFELEAPRWFFLAVERQKFQQYKKLDVPDWFIEEAKKQQEEYAS